VRQWKLELGALVVALSVNAVGMLLLWMAPRPEPVPISPAPPPPRVTRENLYRIKYGMTRAEVEAILGPPGDYTTQEWEVWTSMRPGVGPLPESEKDWPDDTWTGWRADEWGTWICFGPVGTVTRSVVFHR
jgi:hypothetical protein